MIKKDPMRKQLYLVLAIPGIYVLLFLGFVLIQHANNGHSGTLLPGFSITLLILMGISFIGILSLMPLILSVWKRADQRRERARQGDQHLLAKVQPAPNVTALAVPTVIRLRWKPRFFSLLLALPMVLVVLIFSIILIVFNRGNITTLLILGGIVVVFLFMTFGAMALALRKMKGTTRYQLEVNEYGVITIFNGAVTVIGWHDVQIFAIVGVNKARRPLMYELSNPNIVARWMWLPRKMHAFYPLEPELPYEEYDQKMHALLDYIEAKTNLPLYDLTETTNKWYL